MDRNNINFCIVQTNDKLTIDYIIKYKITCENNLEGCQIY